MSDKDHFLSRWSRRKQASAPPHAEQPALAPGAGLRAAQDGRIGAPTDVGPGGDTDHRTENRTDNSADNRTDAQILADLGLPDPATLKPGDDVRGFMQSAVPDRLRRLALRQLWRSNPVLANLDRLVDYGEDYTDAATVVANLQTAYRVGRGFWTEEDERLAAEAAAREDAPTPEATPDGTASRGADAEALSNDTDLPAGSRTPPAAGLDTAPNAAADAAPDAAPDTDTTGAAGAHAAPGAAPDPLPADTSPAATVRRMSFRYES